MLEMKERWKKKKEIREWRNDERTRETKITVSARKILDSNLF